MAEKESESGPHEGHLNDLLKHLDLSGEQKAEQPRLSGPASGDFSATTPPTTGSLAPPTFLGGHPSQLDYWRLTAQPYSQPPMYYSYPPFFSMAEPQGAGAPNAGPVYADPTAVIQQYNQYFQGTSAGQPQDQPLLLNPYYAAYLAQQQPKPQPQLQFASSNQQPPVFVPLAAPTSAAAAPPPAPSLPIGFNPTVFDVFPANARFFVIKSYHEDDVHKAMKYGVWASTELGNRKLDAAYRDATALGGPVYLFFSVNASQGTLEDRLTKLPCVLCCGAGFNEKDDEITQERNQKSNITAPPTTPHMHFSFCLTNS
ncbi:putative YTH domain family protein 2 [Paratrimastix pyriformis]|uniref:YTH domain family protein 2 n=1 Tax=Paratrimastix pyriformis TaxID=342808 RepID=A0ABQ8U855_9EUKA|nr:putative YTH domain family protein 2 [Paratrimastix pyriformis]